MQKLKAGTKMYFGAPANPMPEEVSRAIARAVAQVPAIKEAHLPLCFIEGDDVARQVLVVTVNETAEIPKVMDELGQLLNSALPRDHFLDVLPFVHEQLDSAVREAECEIFTRVKKPWWKFW